MLHTSKFCKDEYYYWVDMVKKITESGQSYAIDNRRMERVSLEHAQKEKEYWKKEYYIASAKEKKGGRRSVTQVVMKDY